MDKNLFIGIDPDMKSNGVAIWDANNKMLVLKNMTFFQLYEFMNENRERVRLVRIEAGWLNHKSNWHICSGQSKAAGEAIARNVGMNHATGIHICEMCVFLELYYEELRPTEQKKDAKEFKAITKYEGRTNQEQRDAAMLVYGI
jgi:hypothetical protein